MTTESLPRRRLSRTLRFCGLGLLLCVRVNLGGCGQASESEFECEEAAQHLSDCCEQPSPMHCELISEYSVSTGCAGNWTYRRYVEPDLLPEVALCVRSASCDDLKNAGICRLQTFLNPEVCESVTTTCQGDGLARTCNGTRTCETPSQSGLCETYRPSDTCAGLARLSCL